MRGVWIMEITYVIGNGPNGVRIPLLAFTSQAQAEELMASLGMIRDDSGHYREVMIDGSPVRLDDALDTGYTEALVGTSEAEVLAARTDIVHQEIYSSEWTKPTLLVWHGAAGALQRALFKGGSYYGGCGECGSLSLVTVPVGAPPVKWNLD